MGAEFRIWGGYRASKTSKGIRTLGIIYELDLIPWQDSSEDYQADVLSTHERKNKLCQPLGAH
jgi:hypothetical protein